MVALSFASILTPDCVGLAAYYAEVFTLASVPALDSEHFRGLWLGSTVLGFSAHSAYDLLDLPRPDADVLGVRTFLTFEAGTPGEVDDLTGRAAERGGTVRKAPYTTYYDAYQSVLLDPEGNAFRINHLVLAVP